MNYSAAVFLMNPNVKCVGCIYRKEAPDAEYDRQKRYHFKTLDHTLNVDDLVLVPKDSGEGHGFTVVQVKELDVEPDIEGGINYRWIIGKIDLEGYEKILEQEKAAISAIKSAKKTKRRQELKEELLADAQESLKAIPIYIEGEK